MVVSGEWDFINDVHYNTDWNYHFRPTPYGNTPDIINHYLKRGPSFGGQIPFDVNGTGPPVSLYLAGNKLVDINENEIYGVNQQASMVGTRNGGTYTLNQRGPHSTQPQYPITIQSADEGKDLVLAQAGPHPLDSVDTRLLGDFFDGGGYSLSNVGDFANYDLQTYNVPQDSDNDGMPDTWEQTHNGLNYLDPSDNVKDRDLDGYLNIEEWINSLGGGSSINQPPQKPTLSLEN